MTAALTVLGRVALIAAAVVVVGALSDGESSPNEREQACTNALAWDRARAEVGRSVVVRGPVVQTRAAATTKRKPAYLDLGEPSPSETRFSVVIPGEARRNWPRPPEEVYEGREIAVRGEVIAVEGVSQMVVSDPGDVAIC